jgi:hypothetical protein
MLGPLQIELVEITQKEDGRGRRKREGEEGMKNEE